MRGFAARRLKWQGTQDDIPVSNLDSALAGEFQRMLLKHTALYGVARSISGILNFVAVAAYTRLLQPAEYGEYSLVVAGVGFCNVIFFQWLRLSLLRFYPIYKDDKQSFLSTLLAGFVVLVFLTAVIGLLLVSTLLDHLNRGLIALGIPLLWATAWFELNLELARNYLQPVWYGIIIGAKSVIALIVGSIAVLMGFGGYGPLIGLLFGMLLTSVCWGWEQWKGIHPKPVHPILREFFRYGLPLTGVFALEFVVSASDRLLLGALVGISEAGLYSATYDLTRQGITMLLVIVNLAGYPLAIRALEEDGIAAAREQLRRNALLLLMIGLPASAGLVLLAPSIAHVALGGPFVDVAVSIIPITVAAALVAGLKVFYFDQAFQLGRWTLGQVWVLVVVVGGNLLLNLWWIPAHGVRGAAWATVVAYTIGLVGTVILGRRAFPLPFPWRDGGKLVVATAVMALGLSFIGQTEKWYLLGINIIVGALIYVMTVFALNVAECRKSIMGKVRVRISSHCTSQK